MKVEDAEEVDGAAQRKHGKSNDSQRRAEESFFLGLALVQGGSVFFYPLLLVSGLTKRRLNGHLEPATVVLLQRHEPERLLTHRDRFQHFRGAKHRPGRGYKHQLYMRIRLHRSGQTEPATGERDDFQLCLSSASVFKSKDSRRDVGQIASWSATVRVKLGEGVHNSEYATGPCQVGDYGRTYGVRLLSLGLTCGPSRFSRDQHEPRRTGVFSDSGQAFQDGDFTGPR